MAWSFREIFSFGRSKKAQGRRGFDAAKSGRLQSGWVSDSKDYNKDIYESLAKLRARSRDLAQNSDYVKRFLALLSTHVVGPKGIALRCVFKGHEGEIDSKTNDEIEEAFKRWGKKGSCDVTGRLSWREVQRLVLQGVARDGEAIVRFVYDKKRPYGLALQVIDSALLDEKLSRTKEGAPISMGVELDEWGKPTAYYLKTSQGDGLEIGGKKYKRIPADEILHIYQQDMAQQTRGVPWIHTAMLRLKMLAGYEEAELVAARVASSKMGFFTQKPGGAGYAGDDLEADEAGEVVTEAKPGSFEVLPEGVEFESWDPEHPAGNFGAFVKACLRGISAGLGVSYNSLANDVESVSYSSLRSSLLEERDYYMCLQEWLVESLCEPVYHKWLTAAVLCQKFSIIKATNMDRFDSPQFVARRWAWVDPLKDTRANIAALEAGLKSRTEIISEQGRSIDDVFMEIKSERSKAQKIGLSFDGAKDGDDDDSDEDPGADDPQEAAEPDEQYLL